MLYTIWSAMTRQKATHAQSSISESYVSGGGRPYSSSDLTTPTNSAVVATCTDYIATTASQVRFVLVEVDSKGVETPVKDKKLQDWVNSPNPFLTWNELLRATISSYLLTGNAYLTFEKVGTSFESWLLPTDKVEVVSDATSYSTGYLYDKKVPYGLNELVHLKQYTVSNPYYGVGITKSLVDELLLESYGITDLKEFYANSSVGQGVLTTPDLLPPKIMEQVKTQLADTYGSGKGRHSVLVLQNGLEYKTVKLSPKESMLLDSLTISEDRIYRAFKLNKLLVGGGGSAGTGNGLTELLQSQFQQAIRPLLLNIAASLELFFKVQYKKQNLKVKLNLEFLPEINTTLTTRADSAIKLFQSGIVSLNEARDQLYLKPLDFENATNNIVPSFVFGTTLTTFQNAVEGQALAPANAQPSPNGSTSPNGGAADGTSR